MTLQLIQGHRNMKKNLSEFYKASVSDYFNFVFNIIIFLPYYFSTITLLKTLFAPWKNLIQQKKTAGFDINTWFSNLSFNLISRGMGFFIRIFMLLTYFLCEIFFLLLSPVLTVMYLLFIPVFYLGYLFGEDGKKQKLIQIKEYFIKNHLLKKENREQVEAWFDLYSKSQILKNKWWSVNNLFSTPPIARDWAVGYTPNLDKYATELTSGGYQNQAMHIIDRETEIKEIEQALLKSEGANVLIVGEAGVGKHTIVDALAKMIYEGRVNTLLAYKRILKLNMEIIPENFLDELFQEAIAAKNIILMVENLDKYISVGEDRINISQALIKHARSPKFQILGITTPFFYQKFVYPNSELVKLFNKVDVYEIDQAQAQKVLLNAVPRLEAHYGFTIPYETIINTLEKSDFFITNIPFPEKAMALLDHACAYLKEKKHGTAVMPELIDEVLTEKTHISTTLSEDTKDKLINLEKLLTLKIINQNQAVSEIASAIRRAFLLLGKRKKPLASFLFLGPTGVGKTETAKVLAQIFFGLDTNLIRFDMSLYQSKGDIPKLIGSVENGEVGLLTEAIRKTPYGILLLDEIEKADRDLINIFLTVLDEGYFTDATGHKVDCKNLIIVATSNAGSDLSYGSSARTDSVEEDPSARLPSGTWSADGDGKTESVSESDKNIIDYLVKQHIFSPEFLNRFDSIDVYLPLDEASALRVAHKMLDKIVADIYKLHKVRLNVQDSTLAELTKKSYDQKFGALNMERLIRAEIEDKAAKLILANQAKEGDTINL